MRTLLKPNEAVKIYAVSVDNHERSNELAKKIAEDGKGTVNFPLLSDPNASVIDAYRLRDPAYAGQKTDGIPHPAVYVIDREGRVTWSMVEDDYKERSANEDIRAALDVLK